MFKKRKKVRLVFKTGQIINVTVSKLTATFQGSGLIKLEWVDMRPNPIYIDIDQVAAIFEP